MKPNIIVPRENKFPGDAVIGVVSNLNQYNIDSIKNEFPHTPLDLIKNNSRKPEWLRLILSPYCSFSCQYPGDNVMMCHHEGVPKEEGKYPSLSEVQRIVRFFQYSYKTNNVVLGGLELPVSNYLLSLLVLLKKEGINDISLTCNGYGLKGKVSRLKDAGLSDLTFSVQHFTRDGYKKITNVDGFEDVLSTIEESKRIGYSPIINRILLQNYTEDLPGFLEWVMKEKLHIRLFDLMWQPGHDKYYLKYHVPWQQFQYLWKDRVVAIKVFTYELSGRSNVVFELNQGSKIEVNLLLPKSMSGSEVCQDCGFEKVCSEGYLGCGVRVTPDLKISPCVLRPNLNKDVLSLIGGKRCEIEQLLHGKK